MPNFITKFDTLDDFICFQFKKGKYEFPVYRKGEGPGIIIMPEMPGISPEVADFSRKVVAAGFTVFMPSLFGVPGKPVEPGYLLQSFASCCIRREFSAFSKNKSSPITDALRALCRQVHTELGGPGVGALGMCFTGNFALSLMVEPCVMAPVLSQPSLPIGFSKKAKSALHVTKKEMGIIRQRTQQEGVSVLGLRFSHDMVSPVERFSCLKENLGENFEVIEIDSGPNNPHNIPKSAHCVLTLDLVDTAGHPTQLALQRVLDFFVDKLKSTPKNN